MNVYSSTDPAPFKKQEKSPKTIKSTTIGNDLIRDAPARTAPHGSLVQIFLACQRCQGKSTRIAGSSACMGKRMYAMWALMDASPLMRGHITLDWIRKAKP